MPANRCCTKIIAFRNLIIIRIGSIQDSPMKSFVFWNIWEYFELFWAEGKFCWGQWSMKIFMQLNHSRMIMLKVKISSKIFLFFSLSSYRVMKICWIIHWGIQIWIWNVWEIIIIMNFFIARSTNLLHTGLVFSVFCAPILHPVQCRPKWFPLLLGI